MRGGIALARAGAPRAADVAERHAVRDRLLEPVPDRAPGAHVLRLLLRPDEFLEMWERPHELGRRVDREWVELLQPADRDPVGRPAQLVGGEVVVDLPGAEHEPPHARG